MSPSKHSTLTSPALPTTFFTSCHLTQSATIPHLTCPNTYFPSPCVTSLSLLPLTIFTPYLSKFLPHLPFSSLYLEAYRDFTLPPNTLESVLIKLVDKNLPPLTSRHKRILSYILELKTKLLLYRLDLGMSTWLRAKREK